MAAHADFSAAVGRSAESRPHSLRSSHTQAGENHMTFNTRSVLRLAAVACWICSLNLSACRAESAHSVDPPEAGSIWAHDNLVAWEVAPLDTAKRTPEERAQMLKRLGFGHYAYLPRTDPYARQTDINTSHLDIDAE